MRKYKRPEETTHILKDLIFNLGGIHLTIVGDGPEKSKLINLVAGYNLSPYVTFDGELTDRELADTVSKSWLNIHTTVTEDWGISIIEAAEVTPTIAYDVPDVSESVTNGLNGLNVPDGDREALKNVAMIVLRDHESWSAMALEVSRNYSWENATNS